MERTQYKKTMGRLYKSTVRQSIIRNIHQSQLLKSGALGKENMSQHPTGSVLDS